MVWWIFFELLTQNRSQKGARFDGGEPEILFFLLIPANLYADSWYNWFWYGLIIYFFNTRLSKMPESLILQFGLCHFDSGMKSQNHQKSSKI